VTSNRRRYWRLTTAGGAGLLLVTLAACGGSTAAATPAASPAAVPPRFISCLQGHGVSAAAGSDANAVRAALQNAGKTRKQSAMSACRQYDGGYAGNGNGKNKNKG
jgi:hypothetical protein